MLEAPSIPNLRASLRFSTFGGLKAVITRLRASIVTRQEVVSCLLVRSQPDQASHEKYHSDSNARAWSQVLPVDSRKDAKGGGERTKMEDRVWICGRGAALFPFTDKAGYIALKEEEK